MGAWSIRLLEGFRGEAYQDFERLSIQDQAHVHSALESLAGKGNWLDLGVQGDWEPEYLELSDRSGDDCAGLGRITVRIGDDDMRGDDPPREIKIIGVADHFRRQFTIAGLRQRTHLKRGVKPDRGFYQEFCRCARERLDLAATRSWDDEELF